MRDKMAIFAYIFEKSRNGPIFKASNQILSVDGASRFYLKYNCTKVLEKNETNRWSIFGKDFQFQS